MRLLSVFGFFGVASALASCPNTQTCNLNVMCTLSSSQLPSGIQTTCQSASTVVPCSTCQQCVGAPECKDSLFYCDYLTSAQAQALPASHPCLSTACQLNKNSASCVDSTYKYCCIPGTPDCNQTSSTPACTPSGCSYFLGQQASTPNYTNIVCPFQNATATCKLPQCNTDLMFKQIVNSFAGSVSCSGTACFTTLVPTVCAAGVNLTSVTTANFAACTNYLVDYCTKNPTDPGCIKSCPYNCNYQDNCPCNSTACQTVNQAPICVRTTGACATFRSMLVNAMFLQRNFQPLSDSLVYSKNYAGPPESPFQWSSTLLTARDTCNSVVTGLADQITTCVQTSFLYCNANPWDPACQSELSVCGDGIVSWFETCDEGSRTPSGGCIKCKAASNYECYQQNTICKRCIHQTGWVPDTLNANICPFCYGLTSTTWPCATTSPCAKATTLAQKTACDDYVKNYCAGIAANPSRSNACLRDPGCDTYVNSTKSFTVPTIPQACEYSLKTIAINDPQLFSLKNSILISIVCDIQLPLCQCTQQQKK
ncbi:hypothetical protein THRCLA_01404 [Thraustotheca clavata]|uniref:Secreted protein n=1 Tax=Thraustotheca clavata TaxID=74557 RepID=A0A1W0A8D2_9STRA|nr:hypothetical protein THRCLA_01404 [Thraustotheca clavata]